MYDVYILYNLVHGHALEQHTVARGMLAFLVQGLIIFADFPDTILHLFHPFEVVNRHQQHPPL